jgi:integrase
MYCDGNGLYLRVGPTGGRSWVLRTMVYGKRRDYGVGSASLVTLAEAREISRAWRKIARAGGDPDTIRKRESLTFEEATKRVYQNSLPTWRSKRTGQIWLGSMERFAYPVLAKRPIATIGSADILKVLEPIWTEKNDTASRVKQRLSNIFDWAKSAGHYPLENPVNGLKRALPIVRTQVEHMAAMPWKDIPIFMGQLAERDGMSARALEFIILTAARSGEVRGAKWAEIDLKEKVWVVPEERMKTGKAHRVPLPPEAISVLEKVAGQGGSLVFPSPNKSRDGQVRPMSDMVFKALMVRMKLEGITTHGFRSTFRDWCSESAHADREVSEAALSHSLGSAVERSYARSDLFERRRILMEKWGMFLSAKSGTVIQSARA